LKAADVATVAFKSSTINALRSVIDEQLVQSAELGGYWMTAVLQL